MTTFFAEILRSERCKSMYIKEVCTSCRSRQEFSNVSDIFLFSFISLFPIRSFIPTSIYLQKSASIQPRTSLSKIEVVDSLLFIHLLNSDTSGVLRDQHDGAEEICPPVSIFHFWCSLFIPARTLRPRAVQSSVERGGHLRMHGSAVYGDAGGSSRSARAVEKKEKKRAAP